MEFINNGESLNDKLKSKLSAIALKDFAETIHDDWNTEQVELLLCSIIHIKEIIQLITRQYFFTMNFDEISKTFYFSHPITYHLVDVPCQSFDSNPNLLIVNNYCHSKGCHCSGRQFHEQTRCFGKVYECFLKCHDKTNVDPLFSISSGNSNSVYVFHNNPKKYRRVNHLTPCDIIAYSATLRSGCLYLRWEISNQGL